MKPHEAKVLRRHDHEATAAAFAFCVLLAVGIFALVTIFF